MNRRELLLSATAAGAKPADIPIDQASQFELALNLKTAREMKMRVPQPIILRADRVIE